MKKEIKSFKDAWTLPFKKDPEGLCCYVWDSKGRMCFDFGILDLELYDRVVKLLNGEDTTPFTSVYGINGHTIMVDNDFDKKSCAKVMPLLFVRGWGYLTGEGGLGLSAETAKRLQCDLIEYCKKKLLGEKDE